LTLSKVIVLPINAIGIFWNPGFGFYYASLMLAFSVGFMIFEDVVVGRYVPWTFMSMN
jgi:hypothetical protein